MEPIVLTIEPNSKYVFSDLTNVKKIVIKSFTMTGGTHSEPNIIFTDKNNIPIAIQMLELKPYYILDSYSKVYFDNISSGQITINLEKH